MSIKDRMNSLLSETAVEPGDASLPKWDKENDPDAEGIDFVELAKHVALAFEALMPSAKPQEVMKVLKVLAVGTEKPTMVSALRKMTTSKARTGARVLRKELT